MSKKKHCHKAELYQKEREEVEASLAKLQRLGLIGESRVVDGELQYYVGPKHLAIMLEILRHPERWPEKWSDEMRAKWYAARDLAIAKGMIEP